MSDAQSITYTADFKVDRRGAPHPIAGRGEAVRAIVPRVAQLMALAIRLEGLVRDQALVDYARCGAAGTGDAGADDADHEAARSRPPTFRNRSYSYRPSRTSMVTADTPLFGIGRENVARQD